MKKALTVTSLVTLSAAGVFAAGPVSEALGGPTQLAGSSTAAGAVKKPANPKPSKTPTAEPPPKALALTPNPLDVVGLAPGISTTRTLTVTNINNQDVILRSITATVVNPLPSPVNGLSCTSPTDFEVLVTNPGTVTIRKNDSQAVPVTIRMNNSSTRNQDGCKGKSFSFIFSATATSK